MNLDRTMQAAIAIALGTVLATWFGVRPLHVRADGFERRTADLLERADEAEVPTARLERLREERDRRRRMLEAECPLAEAAFPPDLASVVGRVSLPIDGVDVVDQTFTAGNAGPAGLAAPEDWRATMIVIETVASWPAIRRQLALVEALEVPVRTTAFDLERLEARAGLARLTLRLDVLHRTTDPGEEP